MDDIDDLFTDGGADGIDGTMDGGMDDGMDGGMDGGMDDGMDGGINGGIDAEGINAAIAASLDTDALFQRIERSHLVGCCQRLAWSKTGCVAYLSADCRKIIIRALFRDKKTAKWSLSDEAPEVTASDDTTFVHVEWGSSGLELVATDQFGRFSIFALGYALNRLQRQPLNVSTSADDTGLIVGLHWLPMNLSSQNRLPLILPAMKEGSRWTTQMKLHEIPGVSNPIENRAAFVSITRKNVFKLIYQQPSQPWSEMSLNLGDPTDSGDLLTHATFCQAPNHMVMATYDVLKRLRLYRIAINWNHTQGDSSHPPSINPQLNLQHADLVDSCVPQSMEQASSAQLSSLHIDPPSPTIDNSTYTVVALFTSAAQDTQVSQNHGGKFSVISRWELRPSDSSLHESFKHLKSVPAQASPTRQGSTLNRLEDVVLQKAVLTVQTNLHFNIYAFGASDGTVEFRSRENMEVIVADASTDRATSLPQNGFSFSSSECIDMSLSLSMATSVITKPDSSVQLHNADYVHGWPEGGADADENTDASVENQLAQAAIVSLARELSIVTCYQSGFDDLLSLIPRNLDKSLRRKFVNEIFRTINRNLDFSLEEPKTQSTKVLKDSLLFRITSAQLVVSYQTDPTHRDIPAKVAWVLLNLRSVYTNMAQTISMTQHVQGISKFEPELLISLKGLVKWSLDLMTLIFDDLFAIMRSCKGKFDRTSIKDYVEKKNTVVLHLLLYSASRSLLQVVGGLLRSYFVRCIKSQEKARSVREKEELRRIEALGNSPSLPFNIKAFEQLIGETDSLVRNTYTAAQANPQQRAAYEQSMLVDAEIPEVFSSVLQRLFSDIVPKVESQVDGVGIFSANTAWLGLGEDEEANRELAKRNPYDVLRKCEIAPGAKIRQCRRCGSHIEDASDGPAWVQNGHKMCICLTHWFVA